MSEEKITKIEEVLMHQEEQITALSDMVAKQWDEIDLLKKRVKRLEGELAQVSDKENLTAAEQAARDKPPHY